MEETFEYEHEINNADTETLRKVVKAIAVAQTAWRADYEDGDDWRFVDAVQRALTVLA